MRSRLSQLRRASAAAAVMTGALVAPVLVAPAATAAETWPARPVTVVVPFPPGGSTSIVARIVTDGMAEALGQSIIVDNRGGAGGALGTRQVARSAPDGYTIALGYTGTLAIGPALFANAGYDVATDFTPIGRIGVAPSTVVVHPAFAVHSIAELIAYAKAHPGEVNYGSAGIGTVGHVAGEYFGIATGIRLTHVPYKGTGPAVTDLLGGHIPLSFTPIPAVHESARSGLLRMLAVTSLTRSSLAPDIPTVAEQGVPDFEAVLRYGLVAPAGTPRAAIERLDRALSAALALAPVRARLAVEGVEPDPGTPEQYQADIAREAALWTKVIKASGARAE